MNLFIKMFTAPEPAAIGLLIPGFSVGGLQIPLIGGWIAPIHYYSDS